MNKILFANKEHRLKVRLLKQRLSEETQTDLHLHNKRKFSLQKHQKFLKEQNDLFYNSYSKATSHLKKNDSFTELKKQYTEKGYKIPNLSMTDTHNLFISNPLLQSNIRDMEIYYNYKNKQTANTERPKRYLLKIQTALNQRINNIKQNSKQKLKEFSTYCSIRVGGNECLNGFDGQSNKETVKENEALMKYNKMMEGIIENENIMSLTEKRLFDKGKESKDKVLAKRLRMSQIVKYNSYFNRPSQTFKSFQHALLPSEDNSNPPSESSAIDTSMSLMNSNNMQKGYQQKGRLSNILEPKPQSMHMNQLTMNSYNTNTNTNSDNNNTYHSDCSSTNKKRNTVLGKITKRNSNVSLLLLEKVFESKQKFFEYLREINISTLTYNSLLIIIKNYLRKIRDWKEETINKFLSLEYVFEGMTGLILDFSQKIAHYDIMRNIPDKTKTSNIKRLMKTDTISKRLPKHIIKRIIRGASCKKRESSI